MTPERWQNIEKIFHATLEFAVDKRASFLGVACGGDDSLRSEVESLLQAHERDGSFLDSLTGELSADLADSLAGLETGAQIGPYKILSQIATGGMGQVYLAQDFRLGRKIVLKLLPPDFDRDQHRVQRFKQEARAASALNHPNVCVIHEIGKTRDGRHFIAMEYIDGITLRERITRGPLKLAEALFVADHVSAALAAAHAAGVVHRDIKPENIMLRKDGYVKVLDFGLAKLSEREISSENIDDAKTISKFQTEPGTQMGTVRYMSPEHLRDRPVDERTDIWSLGIVLHEMVTGVTPFEARSRNEIIAAILKKPPRLALFDDLPAEFEQIVTKTLSKKRKDRYQTMADLAADLKKLRSQLQEIVEEPLLVRSESGRGASKRRTISKSSQESATRLKRKTGPAATSDLWSSPLTYVSRTAGHLLTEIREHPKTTVFAGIAAVLVIFAGLNSHWFPSRQTTVAPFHAMRMTPLTNTGQSAWAAISPDGKWVARAEKKDGMQQLLITSIATAGTSVLVPPRDVQYRGITFSHDGNYIYFTLGENSDAGALYQLALPGGTPRKLKDGVDSPISFSPNGDRFAFVRSRKITGEYSLVVAGTDGSSERTIATRRDANTLSVGPTWAPDERTIVCAAGSWDNGYHSELIEFDVESGIEKPISGRRWYSIFQVAWLGNKSGLIISAKEQPLSPIQLWRVSYPQGESEKITNDTANYETVSLSRDGNTIVSIQSRQEGKLWVTSEGNVQQSRAIASTVGRVYGLSWLSNGRIVFSSMVGNNLNISAIDADGSNQTQLTVNAGDNYTPTTSPDGRFIVFASNRTGSLNIWRMNAGDGGDAKQLTFSDGNSYPSCSPDGKWVVYDNQSNPTFTVWKVPMDGGAAVRLTDQYTRMPIVSPDGQFIAARHLVEGSAREIAIYPFDGGSPIQRLPISVMDWQRVEWTPDGRALTYIDTVKGVSNIWSYELSSRSSKQLTDFTTDQIFAYGWSRDHKQLACLRGSEPRDVTIISNGK